MMFQPFRSSALNKQRCWQVCKSQGMQATLVPSMKTCNGRLYMRCFTSEYKAETRENSKTQEIFKEIEQRRASRQQAGGAGGGTTYEALRRADAAWTHLRNSQPGTKGKRPSFVRRVQDCLSEDLKFDVIICGGTLGIFLACALQYQGHRVVVVERGPLKGRDQEWNISRKELQELVKMGILTAEEVDTCVTSEFNPVRMGFHGGDDVWTTDVLNTGIRPDMLIEKVKMRFQHLGGKVLEFTAASGVEVFDNGVLLRLPQAESRDEAHLGRSITAKLLVDCMGNFSPIVQQLRFGSKPDGVCLVVGTCSRGFDPQRNTTGDVIYTHTDIQAPGEAVTDLQYFWEAFPAGSSPSDRTTYMFTYIDAEPQRPGLEDLLEDYWRLMPEYQGVKLEELEVQRILFGFFPTYRDSPLKPGFDRVLQIGDASGIQSPLSFGGFGALSRYLPRLERSITEALQVGEVGQEALAAIQAYNPGLSSAWMLQRAMSVRPGAPPAPDFINRLLASNFRSMQQRGDPVLKPFLQDVVKFGPLGATLLSQMAADPIFILQIFRHVGLLAILDWTRHFAALGFYTALYSVFSPLNSTISSVLNPSLQFYWRRTLDAWEYGSGSDYRL